MARILVVDDDSTVREVVAGYLVRAGLEVVEAADGPGALTIAQSVAPDLVVLDLTLPGLDGLEVFRRLRRDRPALPVLLLTARGEESDRVLGLEIGADDYVTKPFSNRELVLRVQSILRRAAPEGIGGGTRPDGAGADGAGTAQPLVDGPIRVDLRRHEATMDSRILALTTREFDLLAHFVRHPGRAFSRRELMEQVWGWEYGDESTVTVHVRRLREKVEADPSSPVLLQTVWGVGYRWEGTL